ncbi:MAG: DUF2851 family protein [Bacteroidota bacterium]|nr:DUF2851 family protein [Bacteroidota bacterium]
MQESFLHFVWQFQYFNKKDLFTCDEENLNIIHPGILNPDAGPDFLNTKILIGDVQWFGQAEVHIFSSDWNKHEHGDDAAYDNVILHIVWEDDKPVIRVDGSYIPTLSLKGRISEELILKWQNLIKSEGHIPCSGQIMEVKEIIRLSMMDKSLFERLQMKATRILNILQENGNDWETTTYQLLASNFGFKINSNAFLELSSSLPYKFLLKHQDNIFQLEALLFGQAGLLEENIEDEYFYSMKKEFAFLKHKYNLLPANIPTYEWKFLRLRPANFPTIRIAQFAMLLHKLHNLFAYIKEVESPKELYKSFGIKQSSYWQKHYHFGKISQGKVSGLGKLSIENIIINTLAPLLAAYGISKQDQFYIDNSVELLQSVAPEDNKILRFWNDIGIYANSGFDSQSLIQLYNEYCSKRKCLSCNIGTTLLKKPGNNKWF